MKNLLLIVHFIFISSALFSQNLLDSGNVWTVPADFSGMIYFISGDTFLNNYNYKKLYISIDSTFSQSYYVGALRQDTNNKIYYNDWLAEKLLYDFNLNVGDTFQPNWVGVPMIVDSIDTIQLLNGEHRRRMLITGLYPEYWIDGIGSSLGLLQVNFYERNFDQTVNLNCFFAHDTLKYHGYFWDCYFFPTGINDFEKNSFSVYPNPFFENTTISFNKFIQDGKLVLYNNEGIKVKIINHINGTDVKIRKENMSPGLYYFNLTNGKENLNGKFLMQ